VNVSARACGIAIRAFELAIDYAQSRQPSASRSRSTRAIAFKLAEMGPRSEAAHLMMVTPPAEGLRRAVRRGGRHGQTLAVSFCAEVTQESFRIHGGYGFQGVRDRALMREAPFLLIGEGTSEIQKTIIAAVCCGSTVHGN